MQRAASFDHLVGADEVDAGTAIPSALAVLRLMTNSNLVGCSTGKSAGSAPFKILSTNVASRSDERFVWINCRQSKALRFRDDAVAKAEIEVGGTDNQPIGAIFFETGKGLDDGNSIVGEQ